MSLCRHYVRELRRSVLVGTPDPEKRSQRSSALLEGLGDMEHPAAGPSMYASDKERDQDAQMSAFLREDGRGGAAGAHDSPQSSQERQRIRPSPQKPSPSFSTPRDITTDSNSPAHTVARQDIRASAEKILYTFLLPGAEREITLPGSITQDVTTAIEDFGRDDPEVFDVAKDYVFQAMERDAFPGFLRMKALGNLIPPTLIMRLILGLVAMFGAFWTAFILIFLDESRRTRLWVCSFLLAFIQRSEADPLELAHTAVHGRRIQLGLLSILAGPSIGAHRPKRVHALQLLPDQRAICSPAARSTCDHGPCGDRHRRCCTLCTLHSCAWQATLILGCSGYGVGEARMPPADPSLCNAS
jgi:hypothetical protein